MATEYKYICDGCSKDIGKTVSTSVETQEYDRRPEEKVHGLHRRYTARVVWDLCQDCVQDVIGSLKYKSKGVEE